MARRGRVIPFPTKLPPPDERALTEVHRCAQAEAIVVKGLFESEGIPTVLRSRIAHSVTPSPWGPRGRAGSSGPRPTPPRGGRCSLAMPPRRPDLGGDLLSG